MEERTKESAVGCGLVGGLAMIVGGLILTFLIYSGGAFAMVRRQDPNLWVLRGVGPAIVLLGLATLGVSLWLGIREGRRLTSGKGALTVDPHARIMARFAYDREGHMIVDEWLFNELDGLKFYIKIEHSDGRVKEYQCHRQVHGHCGEGMRGVATFDGRWLGGFAPTVGSGPQPSSYDPRA